MFVVPTRSPLVYLLKDDENGNVREMKAKKKKKQLHL